MERALRMEWKMKLAPKLMEIRGVNGVEAGNHGLVVEVEKKNEAVAQRISDFMEREAFDIPYRLQEVGRTVRMPSDQRKVKHEAPRPSGRRMALA